MKSLFPLNVKKHDMKNRKKFKYKVFKVNTERYKKSSVISMQKLLNNEYLSHYNKGNVHTLVPNP